MKRSSWPRWGYGVGLVAVVGLAAACSSTTTVISGGDEDSGAADNTDGGDSFGADGGTLADSGTHADSGSPGSKDSGATDSGSTTLNSADGFGAAREACVNEINRLRGTEGHAAYTLWTSASVDTCVDEQATNDQTDNSAHEAWIGNKYPTCNGNGQNECLGYGTSAAEVVACLDSMWGEKNQPNCVDCYKCQAAFSQSCISSKTCDFYGNYGSECGHYVNMSADYMTEVACGFSTLSGGSGWAVQNFQ